STTSIHPNRYTQSYPTRRSSDLPHIEKIQEAIESPEVEMEDKGTGNFEELILNNVSFSYDGKLVLENFSMQVKKGEIVALIGRRSEEHTSELQSREKIVCRLLLE